MNAIRFAILLAGVLSTSAAFGQTALKIATCGTAAPPAGFSNLFMDATGDLCTSATISGSVTVNSAATAGSAPPSYSDGTHPLSQTLSGGLRVQLNLAGTDIGLGQQTKAASVPVVLPSDQTVTVAPPSSTPAAGAASAIVTGGSATTLITGPVNGCYITNPLTASDQNIAAAEVAYVNPATTATANGRGTNSALQPGQSWSCPPGQTTNVSAIATTTAHAFNVVKW